MNLITVSRISLQTILIIAWLERWLWGLWHLLIIILFVVIIVHIYIIIIESCIFIIH